MGHGAKGETPPDTPILRRQNRIRRKSFEPQIFADFHQLFHPDGNSRKSVPISGFSQYYFVVSEKVRNFALISLLKQP